MSLFVAAMMRTFCILRGTDSPTFRKSPSWSTRRSCPCISRSSSATSSRNSVPFAAASRSPRLSRASVNAPFTLPKSLLSKRLAVVHAQLNVRNAPFARLFDLRWISCATVSLPVPLGPVMSTRTTGSSHSAAFSAICRTSSMCGLTPISSRFPHLL